MEDRLLWGMGVDGAVDQDIRALIQKNGRITFAQFMEACLYSPRGGFYTDRGNRISTHFGTAPMSHPVFGSLIVRQLEQMWHLLGDPPVFHVIEVGSGDGDLAQSIVQACWRMAPKLAQVLCYVAVDYEPRGRQSPDRTSYWDHGTGDGRLPSATDVVLGVPWVKTVGLQAFRNVVGCILSNELIDNFPVHRFAIERGSVKEVFVTISEGQLTEILDEPSSPRIEERLTRLGLSLAEGYRGEVNLAIEGWTSQLSRALDRGFILTIDYGQLAVDLYSHENRQGTLVCYHRHVVSRDPYKHVGQQDITFQVDFTSLMRLGEEHGLATVGYTLQSQFLTNLGFSSFLDGLPTQGLSEARMALNKMAMMALVDSEEYGDYKVLAQVKGKVGVELLGFESQGTPPSLDYIEC